MSSTGRGKTTPTLDDIRRSNITASGIQMIESLDTRGGRSEDCLFLNVWTKPQDGEEKKSVSVFIKAVLTLAAQLAQYTMRLSLRTQKMLS